MPRQARSAELRSLIDGQVQAPAQSVGRESRLRRLCGVLVRVVPASAAGLTVSVGHPTSAVVLAGVGDRVEELEELQLTLGEGPGIEVARLSRPILEPDLVVSGSTRWPAYGPAAHTLGAEAVFAFPLQVGAIHLGVLHVYRPRAGVLPMQALVDCLLLADIARNVMLEDLSRDDGVAVDPQWDDVLPTPELYQAQGMVMVQLSAGPVDALARIRAHAYAHDERIGDIAREIVGGRLELD
jgi:hypothetical protein